VTKPFSFAHEIELKQSRIVAKSKRASEVALPVAADSKAAYAAGARTSGMDRRKLLKLRKVLNASG
jgi:hypothetical protein